MDQAVKKLTLFLRLATAIDDEVADFTHKDGWPKLDKVLSLVYRQHPQAFSWLSNNWLEWIGWLHRFAKDLTVSDREFFWSLVAL